MPKSTMVKKSKILLHALTVVLVEHIKMLAKIDQYLGWANNDLGP